MPREVDLFCLKLKLKLSPLATFLQLFHFSRTWHSPVSSQGSVMNTPPVHGHRAEQLLFTSIVAFNCIEYWLVRVFSRRDRGGKGGDACAEGGGPGQHRGSGTEAGATGDLVASPTAADHVQRADRLAAAERSVRWVRIELLCCLFDFILMSFFWIFVSFLLLFYCFWYVFPFVL